MTISVRTEAMGSSGPRIGIDSYSYHRLLGETRPGERPIHRRWTSADVLTEAERLDVGVVSLESCFIDRDRDMDVVRRYTKAGNEVILAWGHRDGLSYGRDQRAIDDARTWIDDAVDLGCRLVRIVAASPWVERATGDSDRVTASTLTAIGRLLDHCGDATRLVLETHADLSMDEFVTVVDALPALGVCFDTANVVRVGGDPVRSARLLRERIEMIHLKDVQPSTSGTAGPTSCFYGEGVIDLDGVLAAVGHLSFQGAVCVELGHLGGETVDEQRLVADCVQWLRTRLN